MPDDESLPEVDHEALRAWLADVVDPAIEAVSVSRLAGGHSSGAWRIDAVAADGARAYVLKAPDEESVVFRRDVGREGRIIEALHAAGAPVPGVIGVDPGDRAVGRPCFVMELVAGRSPGDSAIAGYHDDPWMRGLGPAGQRAVWSSFYDALAALHAVDGSAIPEASRGGGGLRDVVAYWRAALLDVAHAEGVPRQLAALDWLASNLPPGADDRPAVCMGDARLANCLFDGTEARALIDFEVAYLGNPAADVGYSIFCDELHRSGAADPVPGIGTADEAWARWREASGRDTADRAYWTAFGAMVIAITGSRAMVQWGLAGDDLESGNPLVPAWEARIAEAGA